LFFLNEFSIESDIGLKFSPNINYFDIEFRNYSYVRKTNKFMELLTIYYSNFIVMENSLRNNYTNANLNFDSLKGNYELVFTAVDENNRFGSLISPLSFASETLKKDGPMSMGSTMRVMADSPLFLGLVNYMHKSLTAEERQALQSGIEKRISDENIARRPQSVEPPTQNRPGQPQGKFY
jgi:hypothetical protein